MAHRRSVIAHHLVFTGYGHWFPNDPRGSGSETIRQEKFVALGAIHAGRKAIKPSRPELRAYVSQAEPLLEHPVLWFEADDRDAIENAFSEVIRSRGYTAWACAILQDHAHVCVRIHRDDYNTMWDAFAETARDALRKGHPEWGNHPIWSARPYSKYCYDPEQVRAVIEYIRGNPAKQKLPAQTWDFIREYDGWPFHKRKR